MRIKKVIDISTVTAMSAVIGAILMDRHKQNKNSELIGRVIRLVNDLMKYDDEVLALANEEHKKSTEIMKKYKQLCKEYDELQNEYNEMLDYYNEN